MFSHTTHASHHKESDVSQSLPEAAPHAGNAYEEDDSLTRRAPEDQGEAPRKPDHSQDDKPR